MLRDLVPKVVNTNLRENLSALNISHTKLKNGAPLCVKEESDAASYIIPLSVYKEFSIHRHFTPLNVTKAVMNRN
jgi:hypothetical protein